MQKIFEDRLGAKPVMVILRGFTPARTVALCERAADVGVGLIEVPAQTPESFDALAAAIEWGRTKGQPIGAGTVTTVGVLHRVHEAGAAFTVAPGTHVEVITESARLGLPHLPGVATATDVQTALSLGCSWQKAFPASVLGGAWISAMHGPFPEVRFVATGGIDSSNAQSFLDAGASAVSIGSAFTDDAEWVRRLLS
jgi:Entner-Doudoroff aldolase